MKKKDIVYLLVAVVILLAAGYLAYTQLFSSKSQARNKGVMVEKIGKIPSTLDESGLSALSDTEKARSFDAPVDLTGLNNPAPFGQ